MLVEKGLRWVLKDFHHKLQGNLKLPHFNVQLFQLSIITCYLIYQDRQLSQVFPAIKLVKRMEGYKDTEAVIV